MNKKATVTYILLLLAVLIVSLLIYFSTGSNSKASKTSNTIQAVANQTVIKAQNTSNTIINKASTLSGYVTPSSFYITSGNSILLTAHVNGGTPPYDYQWYLEPPNTTTFTEVAGATSSTYLLIATNKTAKGLYHVSVSVHDSEGFNLPVTNTSGSLQLGSNSMSQNLYCDQGTNYQCITPYFSANSGEFSVTFTQNTGQNWTWARLYLVNYTEVPNATQIGAENRTGIQILNLAPSKQTSIQMFISPTESNSITSYSGKWSAYQPAGGNKFNYYSFYGQVWAEYQVPGSSNIYYGLVGTVLTNSTLVTS